MVSDKTFHQFSDCQVQAWRAVVGPKGHGFDGGPIIHDDKYSMLRHCRFGSPFDKHETNLEFNDYVTGTFNYLGPVYNHFGHIMSEMIHRILPSRRVFGCDQWLVVASLKELSTDYEMLPSVYREILKIFGIDKSNMKIINRDSVVQKLNISEQHSQFGVAPDVDYLKEISNYIDPILDNKFGNLNKKSLIYVSRSRVSVGGGFLGEQYIQNILHKAGFTLFHPQEHSILRQLDTYRKTEAIIFPEGSACHGTELLGYKSLGRVLLLSRRSNHSDIFRRVLAPRSSAFTVAPVGIGIGSVVTSLTTGMPLDVYQQSVFDTDRLIATLDGFGVNINGIFDKSAYRENAIMTFDNHVKNCFHWGFRTISDKDISQLRRNLFTLLSK